MLYGPRCTQYPPWYLADVPVPPYAAGIHVFVVPKVLRPITPGSTKQLSSAKRYESLGVVALKSVPFGALSTAASWSPSSKLLAPLTSYTQNERDGFVESSVIV